MSAIHSRRRFLREVGGGMLATCVGVDLACHLGPLPGLARAADDGSLTFGDLEALVDLMQDTPADKLLGSMTELLRAGTPLKSLLAAGALANARKFGGEDYIGFHTLMAMMPAWNMAKALPENRQALPVFKVLYRNASRIQDTGGSATETLHPLAPAAAGQDIHPQKLLEAVRAADIKTAESIFANMANTPEDALNAVLWAVEDQTEVHRVVLPYRSYALLELVGPQHAQTLLRQSLHYCVKNSNNQSTEVRDLLTRLLDQYDIEGAKAGTREADDAWIKEMCHTLLNASGVQAADAAAAALAEGFSPDALGEAISLCATEILLRDSGRDERTKQANKPVGSVHGDSLGVHASDAVNAWRNMAAVASPRHRAAGLILAAYEVGRDSKAWSPSLPANAIRPHESDLAAVRETAPDKLLSELDGAIRENAQGRACALVDRYGAAGHDARAVFDVLLKFAVSEDGALHAEKYFHTVSEEFGRTRPSLRWAHLTALARVTASQYGYAAPGLDEAKRLLKA